MTITWSPRDIECHLRAYIARDNPSAVNRITSALLEAIERLANFMIWRRRYPEHRTREAEVAEAVLSCSG